MPIYEYECEECKTVFEVIHGISETPKDIECPSCRSKKVKKMISAFSSYGSCGSCSSSSGVSSRFT